MRSDIRRKIRISLIFIVTHVNARGQTEIRYSNTNNLLEFDVWIPQHQLCFEFQVCETFFVHFLFICLLLVIFILFIFNNTTRINITT